MVNPIFVAVTMWWCQSRLFKVMVPDPAACGEMCEDLLCDTRHRNNVRSRGHEVPGWSIDMRRSAGKAEERVNRGVNALEDIPVYVGAQPLQASRTLAISW